MHTGIYKIENAITGKMYVGSGVDVRERLRRHRKALRDGVHDNERFQHAWNKYGEGTFSFDVLLYCAKKDLILYEQRSIDGFRSADRNFGFNICAKAYSKLGVPCSEKSKQVTSERCKGVAPCLENRLKTIARNKSQEQRDKVSRAHKGRIIKPEWIAKANLKRIGRPLSEKTRAALEPYWESKKGVPRPDIAERQLGTKRSPETKAKMSAARKAWWARKISS